MQTSLETQEIFFSTGNLHITLSYEKKLLVNVGKINSVHRMIIIKVYLEF